MKESKLFIALKEVEAMAEREREIFYWQAFCVP